MKQLLTILLVVMLIVSAGCSSKNHLNNNSVSDTSSYVESQQDQSNTSQKETSDAEDIPTTTERSDDTTTKESVSTESTPSKTDNEVKSDKKEPQNTVSDTTSNNTSSKKETTSQTGKPKEESKDDNKTDSSTSSVPTEPTIPKATADDAKAVAAKMVEYINAYRAEQGVPAAVVLPGLTKYAEYRSRQLVSNFAHDTTDERAAATALEYGEYIDPPLYGMTGEPYYTANAREAIAKTEYGGTVDDVAKHFARMARNSSSHWTYVGGARYVYIAVGVTYQNGTWYCDIAVTSVNTDN